MKRILSTWIVLLAFGFLLRPARAAAQFYPQPESTRREAASGNSWLLEMTGQIGGLATKVVTKGNYAYVGVGSRLVVLDITDPSSPSRIVGFPNSFEALLKSSITYIRALPGSGCGCGWAATVLTLNSVLNGPHADCGLFAVT